MLQHAILYKEQIERAFLDISFDENFKFLDCRNYRTKRDIYESSADYHQFASIDSDGKLIGFLEYKVDRWINAACAMTAVNFVQDSKSKIIFAKDLMQLFKDIFYKFNLNKLNWGVIIGNQAEKSYDRLAQKIGGRIVGIKKNDVFIIDNRFYDYKMYEVLREDFINIIDNRK